MHVYVEQQRRLADVLHNGTVVLSHTDASVSASSGRRHAPAVRRTAGQTRPYNVEPVQKHAVSKKYVGLHQVFVVRVDTSTNAAVCRQNPDESQIT